LFWGSLAGFIINPILGVWSDGLMFKWGRRRIFVVIGGVILIASMLLMMFCEKLGSSARPANPLPAQQGFLIFAIVLIFAAGNIIQAPARTLCSDVCPPTQQLLMSDVTQVYGGLGGVITSGAGALKLHEMAGMSQPNFVLVVCLSLSFIAMVVGILAATEEPLSEKPPSVNPFKQIITAMKNMPSAFKRIVIPTLCVPIAIYQWQVQFTEFMGKIVYDGDTSIDATDADKVKYDQGLSHAMLCNVILYLLMFLWGFANAKVCEKLTIRWVYVGGMIVCAVLEILFFFVKNKWAYLVMDGIFGIITAIVGSLPYAIVSMCIPVSDMGGNLGLVVCLNVMGQQISNFGIGQGIGAIKSVNYHPGKLIGISCVAAIVGAVSGFWIITPDPAELEEKNRLAELEKEENSTVDGEYSEEFVSEASPL
jgi:solute carrier family 45 protein 1/2/4